MPWQSQLSISDNLEDGAGTIADAFATAGGNEAEIARRAEAHLALLLIGES